MLCNAESSCQASICCLATHTHIAGREQGSSAQATRTPQEDYAACACPCLARGNCNNKIPERPLCTPFSTPFHRRRWHNTCYTLTILLEDHAAGVVAVDDYVVQCQGSQVIGQLTGHIPALGQGAAGHRMKHQLWGENRSGGQDSHGLQGQSQASLLQGIEAGPTMKIPGFQSNSTPDT